MAPRQEAPARPPRRGVLALVALVGLLGLVAIGSVGRTRVVDVGGRRPSYLLLDTMVSLMFVVFVLGAIVWVYLLISQREYLAAQRRPPGVRRTLVAAGVGLLLVLLLLSVRVALHLHGGPHRPKLTRLNVGGTPTTKAGAYRPHFAAAPVLLVLGIAASAALAAYLPHRSRRRALGTPADEQSLALTLADLLDDTLDDLRAEPDPRRAVIAAYARLERTLGAFGLPRRVAEAPDEYLHRILANLEVSSRSAQKLTQLFARAKFSQHEVDPTMKAEAIQLLETIRTDLREADERSRAQADASQTTRPRVAW